MVHFRVLSILIILSIFSQDLKASTSIEQSTTQTNKDSSNIQKTDPSHSFMSKIWHLTTIFSSFLSNSPKTPTEIPELAPPQIPKLINGSWHTITDQEGLEWQRQGHDLFYHVASLCLNNFNNFFLYLTESLDDTNHNAASKRPTDVEFTKRYIPHKPSIDKIRRQIKEIGINQDNLPEVMTSLSDLYEEINKGKLSELISDDYAAYSELFSEDEKEFMDPNFFNKGVF